MTPIALKYIARGITHRAVTQFDLIAGAYVNVWRLLFRPERRDAGGSHWLHPELDAELVVQLPRLGATIDQRSVLDALTRIMGNMRQLEPELEEAGVVIPVDSIAEVESFSRSVGEIDQSTSIGS